LCNKNSCADVQISITVRIQALRDVFIQILKNIEHWNITKIRSVQDVPLYNLTRTDVASNMGRTFTLLEVWGVGNSFYRDVISE